MARDQVFISYSHVDSEWLTRLQTMLTPLQRQGVLDVWADTRIQPGQLWKEEIQKALARAKAAVLLVSPDFLASEFIYQDELPPLLEASRNEGLTILWVPIRPSLYSETVIAHYQAAHEPRAPLSTLPPAQQEMALVVIAKKLMAIQPICSPTLAQPSMLASSPATIPIPEQVPQTPSSPPTSPKFSPVSPPQPFVTATTRHDWKPLLIGVVLGILGGAGVYYVGYKWLEQASIQTPSPATNLVQSLLQPMRVEGIWESPEWGFIKIKQAGSKVSAEYAYSDQEEYWYGYLEGEVVGKTVNFEWWESLTKGRSYDKTSPGRRGDGYFVLSDNGSSLVGKWRRSNQTNWAGDWNLIRKDSG